MRARESAFKSVCESVLVSVRMCVRAFVSVDESRERLDVREWCARDSRNVWECVCEVCEGA